MPTASIIIVKNIIAVAYHIQNAVDGKRHLIVHSQAINTNDGKALQGYTHTLLKRLQKVNGKMNLNMFCYNFMRTKNISGFDKMLQAINNWKPDCNKVVCAFKKALMKMIYIKNMPSILSANRYLFLKTI